MKTRFLTALTHDEPTAGFLSRPVRPRIRDHFRIFAKTELRPPPRRTPVLKDSSPKAGVPAPARDDWRFARDWRNKEIDHFAAPAAVDRRFFHCCLAGMGAIAMLLSAGCESSKHVPHYTHAVSALSLKPATPHMSTLPTRLDPNLLQTPTNFFTLGPGDKLDIEMVDETNSLTTTVVGPDGKIYFNLLPGLDVWGLTLGQTRDMLQHELGKYVRGEPQVAVSLRDVQSKRVWLLGRFQQPGVYSMAGPTTVLEAVAAAGGSQSFAGQRQISQGGPLGEDLADLHHSFIVRNGKMLPVDFYALVDKGDLTQNIYLQPDDFIYFAPAYAKEVYVLGAVTQPQPVQYVQGMTLIQAIAGAYGTIRDAYLFHVTIVRGSLATPQIAVVNYYDIVKGKVPDVALQPNDIVYVPFAPYRYLRKYLDTALDTFASTVALNAGTKLTSPHGGATVTIGIPVGVPIATTPTPAPPIH
jgi:protein involved in polysaccharide export with SLBB domain